MKKILTVGAVSVALAALPVVGVFAENPQDTINVTVSESCTLTRKAYATGGTGTDSSHKNGTGGSWSTNTLSATMTNGSVQPNLGSSQFNAVCNNIGGYKVTVATTSLAVASGTQPAIPNNTTYSASVSGWSPVSGSTKLTNGATVKTESATTAGTAFEVSYGVGISATQAAGTYSGTATYSITKL